MFNSTTTVPGAISAPAYFGRYRPNADAERQEDDDCGAGNRIAPD